MTTMRPINKPIQKIIEQEKKVAEDVDCHFPTNQGRVDEISRHRFSRNGNQKLRFGIRDGSVDHSASVREQTEDRQVHNEDNVKG